MTCDELAECDVYSYDSLVNTVPDTTMKANAHHMATLAAIYSP